MHYRKDSVELVSLLHNETQQYHLLLAEKGINIEFVTSVDTVTVFADEKRMKQLFDNLLTNAAKYAADGDLIKISVNVLPEQPINFVEIIFEDNGQGVQDEHLGQLFEHLFRVENSRNRATGGSGLGLSICKKIVQAHHGNIHAFASALGGLGIKIVLPLE
jgi:two-component system sensor histidine kinase BaeS